MKKIFIFASFLLTALACQQHITFLLDASGSMGGQEEKIVSGVNNLLLNIDEKARFKCKIVAQTYLFNYNKYLLKEEVVTDKPHIELSDYQPNGGTALYGSLASVIENAKPGSIIVIATDGQDNQSVRYGPTEIKEKVKEAESKRDIEFIFIAEGMDAFTGGVVAGLDAHALNVKDIGHSFGVPGPRGMPGPLGDAGMLATSAVMAKIGTTK